MTGRIGLRLTLLAALALIATGDFTPAAGKKLQRITIGTGSVTGVYYPAGGAISKLVNKERKLTRVRLSVEATGGSVYNITAVLTGDLEFGFAQSDRQYQAQPAIAVDAQIIRPEELDRLLDQLRDFAQTGNTAAAEQLLNQLQQMMQNLEIGDVDGLQLEFQAWALVPP